MRVDLLEKAVTGVSAVAILLVAGCVTLFSFVQKASGIDNSVVDSITWTNKWLEDQRALARGEQIGRGPIISVPAAPKSVQVGQPATPGQPPPPGQKPAAKSSAPAGRDNYIDENIPPNEQVPGVPWLRQQPGVTYFRPEGVPQIVAQKYSSFDDAFQLAQEGGGEFVETEKGPAYKVNWIDDGSYLRRTVGLQPEDRVISVNGHPVGASFNASRQLYDQLKGEKRFAVKILRQGAEIVLPFYVQ